MNHNVGKILRALAGTAVDGLVSLEIARLSGMTSEEVLQALQACLILGWIDSHFPAMRSLPTYRITAAGRAVLNLRERNDDGDSHDADSDRGPGPHD